MSVSVGLRVMAEMMEEELTTKVGPKHAKLPGRSATRHASAAGSGALGGRRVSVQRPRARTIDNTEVHLDTYATFADDDVLSAVVMERMLAGLATRRHRAANEPVGAEVEQGARSTSKSSVSRRFVAKTKLALDELMARELGEVEVVALMVDGVTSPSTAAWWRLPSAPTAPRCPWGCGWAIPRTRPSSPTSWPTSSTGACRPRGACSWSSTGGERGWVDARLAKAFNHADPATGLRMARDLARQLETRWPDAAASLREGLEEMFTVRRLGVGDRLARTLASTNPIESMISVGRSTTHHVKRWRDVRRVKGCKEMPKLVDALRRHVAGVTPTCENEKIALQEVGPSPNSNNVRDILR